MRPHADWPDREMASRAHRGWWIGLLVSSLGAIGIGLIGLGAPSDQGEVTTFGPSLGVSAPENLATAVPSLPPAADSAPGPSAVAVTPLPVRIEIPTLAVTADVRPVGLNRDRSVVIPRDIDVVGWYRYSTVPGAPLGSAVFVGHRDGREGGHGAFYNLGVLEDGDMVVVTDRDGRRLRYRVVARSVVAKSDFATRAEAVFAAGGAPRLRLISCGGIYLAESGGYQANVIVTAVPVGPSFATKT